MATSQDTEITLGTGKMLGVFFALVVLCAVFFSMGFSVGKNSAKAGDDQSSSPSPAKAEKRPHATEPAGTKQSADMTFYKSVGQDTADSELSQPPAATTPSPKDAGSTENSSTGNPTAAAGKYFVQVAAVSKQDDAQALVDALKRKQYAATTSQTGTDKLFHVEIGPFAGIKDAESVRVQLVTDGYNPILKR